MQPVKTMSFWRSIIEEYFRPVQDALPLGIDRQYTAVNPEDELETGQADKPNKRNQVSQIPRWRIIVTLLLIVFIAVLVAERQRFLSEYITTKGSTGKDAPFRDDSAGPPFKDDALVGSITTTNCSTRREWRSLNAEEQEAYIGAVLCLREQPSVLSSTAKAYDDFPWIHSHVGYMMHNSAPFLPWHRYFLHVYETTLRQKCNYDGGLVYWDWTLDSDALEKSPVFDPQTAFGGDGEVGGPFTVGRSGRCVVDGPFAGINVSFYDVKYSPHCLSRGFRDQAGNLGHMDGHDISPTSIAEVLALDRYEDFVALMESRVHDAIPFGIGGDFETFTAPYDPIFFLHHTQLDRVWWLWQSSDDGLRRFEYGGHKQRHSIEMASLDDDIDMRNLAPSVTISQVMDTEGELLCYRY